VTLFKLVRRNVGKHPVRAGLTFLFAVVALFAGVFLFSVVTTLAAATKQARTDRLAVQSAVSLFVYMPESYRERIERVPGVESVSPWNWFGGYYQEPSNFFAQFATDMKVHLTQYPEVVVDPAEAEELLADRRGALVGNDLATQFGWKVGDSIPIVGTIYSAGPGKAWDFVVRATYRSTKDNIDEKTMFFHWEYLQEMRRLQWEQGYDARGNDVAIFMVKVAEGHDSIAVSEAIDAIYENGPQRTRTQTEAAFQAQFVSMLGNIPAFLGWIGGAVMFAILFSVLNTALMSARERSRDVGILKALGFPESLAARLLVVESVLVVGTGGVVGTALAFLAAPAFRRMFGMLIPNYFVEPSMAWVGTGVAFAIGAIGGLLPAVRLTRLRTVDVLRDA
jgi:putative ABC transport system permease protein